jgi:hypothetical protein
MLQSASQLQPGCLRCPGRKVEGRDWGDAVAVAVEGEGERGRCEVGAGDLEGEGDRRRPSVAAAERGADGGAVEIAARVHIADEKSLSSVVLGPTQVGPTL